ncbi:hypothetical protein [Nocardioides sp.]|uniref:hypothetical protein n=1 Tax=Nocardioides sp. TaxID=35761 RepID=UPI002601EC84|nr:hypothetical protein [Nocardioides sp.]MDI6911299.1 hypothetical protein [Nocardioides sp.]
MTLLRPGLHAVRRDDHHLQIGIDPPWRLVVPDRPEVQHLLDDLEAGRPPAPDGPEAHRVLLALARAGMLTENEPVAQPTAAVGVHGHGPAAAEAARLLRAAGCPVASGDGAVALVLADGEVRRSEVDVHVRDGRPHLLVAGSPLGYTVGPFVVPGATACLRCVDAHRGEHDPRRAVVVEQLGGRPGGPDDPTLRTLAAAWAVRDVLSYLAGRSPSTWSATVAVAPDLSPVRRAWARHPHCGCSWAQGLVG